MEPTKTCFQDQVIIPNEAGTIELIADNYSKIKEEPLFRKGIIRGAEKVAKGILPGKDIEKNLKFVEEVLCALGRGIPSYKRNGKKITFKFLYPPVSRHGFLYFASVLNGFLNYIYAKKLKLNNIKMVKYPIQVVFDYSY